MCIGADRPNARRRALRYSRPAIACAAKMIIPPTHTRLPRYVRGHVGAVERVLGFSRISRQQRDGAGENPQWLYTVTFDGRELWGQDADPTLKVSVDAWEPYLEPA